MTHNLTVDIRQTAFVAALAGGLLWAMANSFSVIFAPVTPETRVLVRCLAEAMCAVLAAGIGGWFAAPGVCTFLRITDVEVVSVIGLGVGLIAWVVTPALIALLSKIALSRIGKVGDK